MPAETNCAKIWWPFDSALSLAWVLWVSGWSKTKDLGQPGGRLGRLLGQTGLVGWLAVVAGCGDVPCVIIIPCVVLVVSWSWSWCVELSAVRVADQSQEPGSERRVSSPSAQSRAARTRAQAPSGAALTRRPKRRGSCSTSSLAGAKRSVAARWATTSLRASTPQMM